MNGSRKFSVSKQELGQIVLVSLLFGAAAAVGKFIELGSSLDWGDFSGLVPIAAAALAWLAKRYLTDTRDPQVFANSRYSKGCTAKN